MSRSLPSSSLRWLLLAGIAVLTAACTSSPPPPVAWTLMVYMEADNNLELDALLDLFEMEMVGSSDEVHVLVQIDRAEAYTQADDGWSETRRFRVEGSDQHPEIRDLLTQRQQDPTSLQLASTPLESIGEIDGGDPASLTDFLTWGIERYPADRYGVILLSHGGTWSGGFGADTSHDHSAMSLPDLDLALTDAREQTGAWFEFIGFDACLMGQLEVYEVLSRHASYAAAAQELEPAYGWYYTPLLEQLTDDPTMGGDQLAAIAVESFMAFYDEVWPELTGRSFASEYDLAAVDLTRMPRVMAALGRFAAALSVDAEPLLGAIAAARTHTQAFGGSAPDAVDWLSSVDLRDFLAALTSVLKDHEGVQELLIAADDLEAEIAELVIHSRSSEGLPGANGAAVFFPRSPRTAAIEGNLDRYGTEVAAFADWRGFLTAFYDAAERSAGPLEVMIDEVYQADPVVSVHRPITVEWTSRGLNIVRESFSAVLRQEDGTGLMLEQAALTAAAIDVDGEQLYAMHTGEEQAYFTWNADMPALSDGTEVVPTLLMETDDEFRYAISGSYAYADGRTMDATLIVEDLEVVQVWGVNESDLGAQPHEITPNPGDTFTPSWRALDEDGETTLTSSGIALTFGAEPFTVTEVPALSGTYELSIRVEDVAGRSVVESVVVEVDNDGMHPEWRVDTTIEDGISLPYPWDAPVQSVVTEEGLVVEEYLDLEAGFELRMHAQPGAPDLRGPEDLPALVASYLELIASFDVAELDPIVVTDPGDHVPLEMAGATGFQVRFSGFDPFYEADLTGLLLLLWSPDTEMAYVIDVRDIVGDPADYLPVLTDLLHLFPPSG